MLGIEILKRLGGSSGSSGTIVLTDVYQAAQTQIGFTLGNDGYTYRQRNYGADNRSWTWINPQAGMSLYEAKATLVSGTVPDIGTMGAWLNLGTNRNWQLINDVGDDSIFTIQIRRASDSVVVKTITVHQHLNGAV